LERYSLKSVQDHHLDITAELIQKFKPIEHLQAYLHHGAYPFFQDGLTRYHNKLVNVINETLDVDLAFVHGLDPRYATKLKGVLRMVAESVPFAPKVTDLAQALSISRPTVSQYLEYLQEGGLITMVRGVGRGYQKLSKPEKIYLDNTNLAYAMGGSEVDVGAARETFLVSQLKEAGHLVEAHAKADFLVDGLTTIEVGGRNKKRSQIADIPGAFRVVDGVEIGSEGKIPLWLFGFLY
jgi:predicted AAA+ superfamily ATPase